MTASQEVRRHRIPHEPKVLLFEDIPMEDIVRMTGGKVQNSSTGHPVLIRLKGAVILLSGTDQERAMGLPEPGPTVIFDEHAYNPIPLHQRGVIARWNSFSIPDPDITFKDRRERVTGFTYFKNKGFQHFEGTDPMLIEAARLPKGIQEKGIIPVGSDSSSFQ